MLATSRCHIRCSHGKQTFVHLKPCIILSTDIYISGVCWSSLKQPVLSGQYFTPLGKDVCEKCKCLAGRAVGCFFETCPQLPDCDKYEPVSGTCCTFECMQGRPCNKHTKPQDPSLPVNYTSRSSTLWRALIETSNVYLYCLHSQTYTRHNKSVSILIY